MALLSLVLYADNYYLHNALELDCCTLNRDYA